MFNVITPDQVPKLWNNIKFAAEKTGDLTDEDRPGYLLNLLHDLLSSKAQCIIGRDSKGKLSSIAIIRITYNDVTNEKVVHIESLYSFEHTDIEFWKMGLGLVEKFARKNNCKAITGRSTNPRAIEIAKSLGFNNIYQYFSKGV